MRAFITLCIITAAYANKLGYNYGSVGPLENGWSYTPGLINENYGSSSNLVPSFDSQNDLTAATNEGSSFASQHGFEKEFITYTASENDFNEPAASNQYDNAVKQGLRVIFIKGPENNGLENAAVSLAKNANEQKIAIYVLQKQADLSNLANNLNIAKEKNNNKPAVHFVKYRTPEDAANAQKAIQYQYDLLGGASKLHNAGVAPVLNFASSAPAVLNSHNIVSPLPASTEHFDVSVPSSNLPSNSVTDEPNNNYLPASILRLFRL